MRAARARAIGWNEIDDDAPLPPATEDAALPAPLVIVPATPPAPDVIVDPTPAIQDSSASLNPLTPSGNNMSYQRHSWPSRKLRLCDKRELVSLLVKCSVQRQKNVPAPEVAVEKAPAVGS